MIYQFYLDYLDHDLCPRCEILSQPLTVGAVAYSCQRTLAGHVRTARDLI